MTALETWKALQLPPRAMAELEGIKAVEGGADLLKSWIQNEESILGVMELLLDKEGSLKAEIQAALTRERRAAEIHANYRVPIQKLSLEQRLERASRHGLEAFGGAADSVHAADRLLLRPRKR